MKFAFYTAFLVFVLFFSFPVNALEGLASAGITPDNPLYFFDVVSDDLSLAFTFDSAAKAEKAVNIAEERLSEARSMALQGKLDSTASAQKEHEKMLGQAVKALEGVSFDDNARKKIGVEKLFAVLEAISKAVNQEINVKTELNQQDESKKSSIKNYSNLLYAKTAEARQSIQKEKEKIEVPDEKEKIARAEIETGLQELQKQEALEAIQKAKTEIVIAVEKYIKIYLNGSQTVEEFMEGILSQNPKIASNDAVSEEVSKIIKEEELTSPVSSIIIPVKAKEEIVKDHKLNQEQQIIVTGNGNVVTIPVETERANTQIQPKGIERTEKISFALPLQPTTPIEQPLTDSNNQSNAIYVLIRQSILHYGNALNAFDEERYGRAKGQAIAAFNLARNANRLMDELPKPNPVPDINDTNNTSPVPWPEQPRNKRTILHRTVKYCSNDSPKEFPGIPIEQIFPVGEEIRYLNYTCASRKQEQCFLDGTFDTYYDEWCEYENNINLIVVLVGENSSSVSVRVGEEEYEFKLNTIVREEIIKEIVDRVGMPREEVDRILVIRRIS